MLISVSMIEDGIKLISLNGSFDITGPQEIESRFTIETAAETANIIVDLSEVKFMASIGIGMMVRAARALFARKGKLVFMNPQPIVWQSLESTQIIQVIPVVYGIDSARSFLLT